MRTALVSIVLLAATPAAANAPHPGWACLGKRDGDACEVYGGGDGICRLRHPGCQDPPGADPQECLDCDTYDSAGCAHCAIPVGRTAGGVGALALAAVVLGWWRVRRRRRGDPPTP